MNRKGSKPRLALLGVGTLGGGHSWQGAPVQAGLFERLSQYYDIVFYSFSRIKTTHIPKTIRVRQIVSFRLPGRVKYFLLLTRAVLDHFFGAYSLIFSVSVYPSGLFATILGKILKKPVLVQLIASEAVGPENIEYRDLIRPGLAGITKWVCKEADFLVAVAEFQKKIVLKSLPVTREITVLPLRIDSKRFSYRDRLITFPVQFIHVAHYSPVKDQDTMFKAFSKVAQVVDCHLTVIGYGFNVPGVQTVLAELKITHRVTFVGVVMQSELPRYFHDAHILLHTARFETGCAVIQEAMASGVAVCGTEVGILADIGDRYAVTVPPRDAEQLAGKILQLVNDPEHYRRMKNEAYQWIRKYDAVWASKNYHAFIEEILSGSNGGETG